MMSMDGFGGYMLVGIKVRPEKWLSSIDVDTLLELWDSNVIWDYLDIKRELVSEYGILK